MSDKHIENLYQSTQDESTPLALDNLILAQAKNSCDPKQVKTPRKRHWMYSIATAAVVVMSFSIILNLQHENETMMTQPNGFDVLHTDSVENTSFNRTISTENDAEVMIMYKSKAPKKQKPTVKIPKIPLESPVTEVSTQVTNTSTNVDNTSGFAKSPQAIITNDQIKSELEIQVTEDLTNNTSFEETTTNQRNFYIKDDSSVHKKAREYQQSLKSPNKPQLGAMASTDRKKEKKENSPAYRLGVDLTLQIKQLDKLIENKDFKQANILLQKLKTSYPSYDFSKQEELLKIIN